MRVDVVLLFRSMKDLKLVEDIAVLTKDWHPQTSAGFILALKIPFRPGNLNEMLRIAELFSVDFDYVN